MPRLTTLRPRVEQAPARTFGSTAIERKRGRAGVEDRDRIRRRDRGLCQACLERGHVTRGTQVDHVIPLHKGGPDTDANKRLLCTDCHSAKTAQDRAG